MLKHFAAIMLTLGLACQASVWAQSMQKIAKAPKIISEISSTPDGIGIRLDDQGNIMVFSCASGSYDFNDPDDILDARRQATLRAKANLASFLQESVQTDENLDEVTGKVKKLSDDGKKTSGIVTKETALNTIRTIRTSSAAMLQGVVTLASEKIPAGKGGTYRVMLGVSTKSTASAQALREILPPQPVITPQPALPNLPADQQAPQNQPQVQQQEQVPTPATQSASEEGWIRCVGYGKTRSEAVAAALVEGIQQVYGISIQNDDTLKRKVEKMKSNLKDPTVTSKQQNSSDTLTKTAGLVKEFKILSVKDAKDGLQEAIVMARIINPRAQGATALLIAMPTIAPERLIDSYKVGPQRRLSGYDLQPVVGHALAMAFTSMQQFYVMTPEDLENILHQQQVNKQLVQQNVAAQAELLKAGQILTADLLLISNINDLDFSQQVGLDQETKKFKPMKSMRVDLDFKLVDVNNGTTALADTIVVTLNDQDISAILQQDPQADMLKAIMMKLAGELHARFTRQ